MAKVAASGTSVVIDLSDATFIDSQVVGWLVRWSECVMESSSLHLAIATGTDGAFAKRVIDLLGLTNRLPCHPTKTDALRISPSKPRRETTSSADLDDRLSGVAPPVGASQDSQVPVMGTVLGAVDSGPSQPAQLRVLIADELPYRLTQVAGVITSLGHTVVAEATDAGIGPRRSPRTSCPMSPSSA